MTARWNAISGATYTISVRNLTTNQLVVNNLSLGTANYYTISLNNLTSGHQYRIAVSSTVSGKTYWSERAFAIRFSTSVIITNPSYDGQQFSRQALTVQWSAIPYATYTISVRNLTTNALVVNNLSRGTTNSYTIPITSLAEGCQYRIAVSATIGTQTVWTERTFSILRSQPSWIWHSDLNMVGFWFKSNAIKVYTEVLGSTSALFDFPTRMTEARNAWSPVLGVAFTDSTISVGSNIRAYGGSRAKIEEFLRISGTEFAGKTYMPTQNDWSTITVNGSTKTVYYLTGNAQMFIVDNWLNSVNTVKSTTSHELGHALGYWGHSPNLTANENDVMWFEENPHYTLTTNEKTHLKQIYDYYG